MRLFDSHAHLDLRLDEVGGAGAVLRRAWEAGLEGIIAIAGATKPGSYQETFSLLGGDRRLWCTAGIHPHTASAVSADSLEQLRFALDFEKIVALGEIGLDYHYNYSTPAEQRRGFVKQLALAHAHGLPVVIHTRNADDETLSILDGEGGRELGGVIHCFSSGAELAAGAVEMGFYISFSGIVTFPKAGEIQEVAASLPEERILAETDSPFLSPAPKRGKINEPARVVHVVEKLAELRGVDVEELAEKIVENTYRCFRISAEGY